MSDHPDFTAAPEEQRWIRPLAELGTFLREAAWAAKGSWIWRILPGGACVAMRVIPDGEFAFHKELRVSRRGKLETFDQFSLGVPPSPLFPNPPPAEHASHP